MLVPVLYFLDKVEAFFLLVVILFADLVYVNAPKGKPAMFVNFEDICYSTESQKAVSYYTVFIAEWYVYIVFFLCI